MSSTVTETLKLVFEAAWNVLWVGIVLGAGLPLMFALGVRAMARTTITGADGTREDRGVPQPIPDPRPQAALRRVEFR